MKFCELCKLLSSRLLSITPLVLVCTISTFSNQVRAEELKAPFDSYICFDSTIVDCAATLLGENYAPVLKSERWSVDDDGRLKLINIQASYTVGRSGDGKVGCSTIKYEPVLAVNFNTKKKVVFLSPDLFLYFGEVLQKLAIAATACQQLVEKYELQSKLYGLQENAAKHQNAQSHINAELENFGWQLTLLRERNQCGNLPTKQLYDGCIKQIEMPRWGLGGLFSQTLSSAAVNQKIEAINSSNSIRLHTWKMIEKEAMDSASSLSHDYERAFREFTKITILLHNIQWNVDTSRHRRLVDQYSRASANDPVLFYKR